MEKHSGYGRGRMTECELTMDHGRNKAVIDRRTEWKPDGLIENLGRGLQLEDAATPASRT